MYNTAGDEFEAMIEQAWRENLERDSEIAGQRYDDEVFRLAMINFNNGKITQNDVYVFLKHWYEFRVSRRKVHRKDYTDFDERLKVLQEAESEGALPDILLEDLNERISTFKPKDDRQEYFDNIRSQIQQNQLARGLFGGDSNMTSIESAVDDVNSWREWQATFTPFTYLALQEGKSLFDQSE